MIDLFLKEYGYYRAAGGMTGYWRQAGLGTYGNLGTRASCIEEGIVITSAVHSINRILEALGSH